MNTCSNPLKLTFNSGYKVNKPNDQSGEYVDKKIADDLLAQLLYLKAICEREIPEFNIPKLNDCISIAIATEI